MTHPTESDRINPVSPVASRSAEDPEKNSRSEAAGAAISDAVDPQHPPRCGRRLSLLIVMALLLMGVGQAAWPVIDISAVAQLIETVRLAGDTLSEMTTAKDALLGQVATLTGVWDDLTGDAYELGENASSLVTDFSLTQVEAQLNDRRTNEQNAWPTLPNVRDAYAGEDRTVIQQVLDTHREATARRTAIRNASYDAQIVIAEAGEFLSAIEATASNQNNETTQGLGAQLDRQIAVASSTRDIAAKQLEVDLRAQVRALDLDHQRTILEGQLRQQGLAIRTELQDSITDYESNFDAAAFDQSLYTPVLPTN